MHNADDALMLHCNITLHYLFAALFSTDLRMITIYYWVDRVFQQPVAECQFEKQPKELFISCARYTSLIPLPLRRIDYRKF